MKRLLTMMIVAYNLVTPSPLAAKEKSTGCLTGFCNNKLNFRYYEH